MNSRQSFKYPITLVHGVVTSKSRVSNLNKPIKPNMKADDLKFLEALDSLLEKHRLSLVDELTNRILGGLSNNLSEAISQSLKDIQLSIPVINNITSSVSDLDQQRQSTLPKVEIDESVFVVDQKLDSLEKGFQEITEVKNTEDSKVTHSISKLKSLKNKS